MAPIVPSTDNGNYNETDPIYSVSPAAGITEPNISNWDTAYGWGNHATAGYETTTQLNARDTANRNRANHTGTQPWNTITGTPTTTAGYGITDAAFNGQIINGVAHFVQNAAPTTRIDAAGQNIGLLVAGDQWYKPTDNGIPGTAGGWIWNGTYWLGHLRDAQTSYFWVGAFALNNIGFVLPIEKVGCTSVLIKSIYATLSINTGNNVSNYYGFTFSIINSISIGFVNTSALSVGFPARVFINSDPGLVLDVSTNTRSAIFAIGQTIGTPGNTDFVSVGASYYPIHP